MRDAFIDELTALAQGDPRIVVLSADIGNRMFDKFRAAFPDRFINTGIAEANMTGIAAGLAMAGLRPFTYTIAAFNPGRCIEQIRLDVCQHNLPVTVVGVGAGLSYASLGPTHHALEDIAWMRTLPNMIVTCPSDSFEVRGAIHAALAQNGPVYLRLGKKGEPVIHKEKPVFRFGESLKVKAGTDAAILAVGTTLAAAVTAAEMLDRAGISTAVYSFHTVKPLDELLLTRLFAADGAKRIIALEEHSAIGGARSAIAEWLADHGGTHVPFLHFAAPDAFLHEAGNREWVSRRIGIDARAIANKIAHSWTR